MISETEHRSAPPSPLSGQPVDEKVHSGTASATYVDPTDLRNSEKTFPDSHSSASSEGGLTGWSIVIAA